MKRVIFHVLMNEHKASAVLFNSPGLASFGINGNKIEATAYLPNLLFLANLLGFHGVRCVVESLGDAIPSRNTIPEPKTEDHATA